ncbi:hypothetical protein VNO78_35137 [Psophocarpus tetragonolobus]|uniref:Uncharacterized protein n=1 Tax=Psophocarpus tetragonolobus TaxID=3891 RepID=A0AAN9NMF0_PSOTE
MGKRAEAYFVCHPSGQIRVSHRLCWDCLGLCLALGFDIACFPGKRTNLSKSKLRKAWASLSQSVELVTALAMGHPSTNHLKKWVDSPASYHNRHRSLTNRGADLGIDTLRLSLDRLMHSLDPMLNLSLKWPINLQAVPNRSCETVFCRLSSLCLSALFAPYTKRARARRCGVRRVQRRLDPGRLTPITKDFETDRYADAAKANDFASSIKVSNPTPLAVLPPPEIGRFSNHGARLQETSTRQANSVFCERIVSEPDATPIGQKSLPLRRRYRLPYHSWGQSISTYRPV